MNKIEIKNLYLIFGSEKQKALRMLKEGKSKNEILKTTDCTIAVKDANLDIHGIVGQWKINTASLHQSVDKAHERTNPYQWQEYYHNV